MSAARSSPLGFSLPVLFAIICGFCLLEGAYAFGAGNIPSFSFLEGKAFRHGDIEDVLAELIKKSGGILGRGSKFGGLDIKRVYFGNWLRDYSQAMDVAGLSKMPKQTILNLVMGLGFLAHGYASGEFEVTDERLGVYLPTEHIDNPKGYAADQPNGDARKFDPRLRPPIDPKELEIDPASGMKNYIANEKGTWETSSHLVRERINQCIQAGRRARAKGDEEDLYECYRLLGTLLHTLEDFSAHSNWVELSLRRLGYTEVFCHVGDACIIQTPDGPAPPLVTGTFGGSDFIHSLLCEATDHISEASVSDLAKALDAAKSHSGGGRGATDTLRDMLFNLPGGAGGELTSEMSDVEAIRARAEAGDSSTMSPQQLHATLWKILVFRDNVVKTIEVTIAKIPGLSSLVEKITDSINRFIFTTLEPLLKPIMSQATTALALGSAEVINNDDQFEVFTNPSASDPTHSFLSKDHFQLILNEPAGHIATLIVSYTVKQIVNAWEHENVDAKAVADDCLAAFHHPYFFNSHSAIQREMGVYLKSWIDGQSPDEKAYILKALTKESVRANKNKRRGHQEDQISQGDHAGAPPFDHGQRPPIPSSQSSFEGPSFDLASVSMPSPSEYPGPSYDAPPPAAPLGYGAPPGTPPFWDDQPSQASYGSGQYGGPGFQPPPGPQVYGGPPGWDSGQQQFPPPGGSRGMQHGRQPPFHGQPGYNTGY